jgi:hypothetical protein
MVRPGRAQPRAQRVRGRLPGGDCRAGDRAPIREAEPGVYGGGPALEGPAGPGLHPRGRTAGARRLATLTVGNLEGALLLARLARSTEPLDLAADLETALSP